MPKPLKKAIAEISEEEFSDYILPHIIFNSFKEAIIEGSKGVLEYKSDRVKVNCESCILNFQGENLCIRAPLSDELIITGSISDFSFSLC